MSQSVRIANSNRPRAGLAWAALFFAFVADCSGARPAPTDSNQAGSNADAAADATPPTPAAAPPAKAHAPAAAPSAAPAATTSTSPGSTTASAPDATLAAVKASAPAARTMAEARAELAADAKAFESPLELVESAPVETSLDHADVRDAKDVWPSMINRASARIDLAEFYVSDEPGSILEPVIQALEAAAARGVQIRFLADRKMAKTYPETLQRLAAQANIKVEQIDFHELAGGVQHAKYFIVDGAEAYEGSQNFDWRSLSQIQEMGLRFRAPEAVRALEDVFETDWALAAGAPKNQRAVPKSAYRFPTPAGTSDGAQLTFVASPKGWLPDDARWDLPAMVQLIDQAQKSVRVQVLTYRAHGRREEFPELEDALKRAANRGVQVTLLVSHWSLRKGTVEGLQELAAWAPKADAGAGAKAIEVKVLTIPELSLGFVPFARVAHAKYMVIDGAHAWIGTNNWERDYFTQTRNVGLIVDGGSVPPRLEQIFDQNVASPYAAALDPHRSYPAPQVGP